MPTINPTVANIFPRSHNVFHFLRPQSPCAIYSQLNGSITRALQQTNIAIDGLFANEFPFFFGKSSTNGPSLPYGGFLDFGGPPINIIHLGFSHGKSAQPFATILLGYPHDEPETSSYSPANRPSFRPQNPCGTLSMVGVMMRASLGMLASVPKAWRICEGSQKALPRLTL